VTTTVAIGEPAPDFTLPGTTGTPESHRGYTLSDYRGQPVVLAFYPGDNTAVCTRQLNSYTTEIDAFSGVDAQVLAISPQSIESHDGFIAAQGGFAFPLLSDGDKQVGRLYGILGPVGFYRRSIFVVDADGVVRHTHRAVAGLSFRPTAEIVAAIAASR
jgi:peroxiredoxin Q/BCP